MPPRQLARSTDRALAADLGGGDTASIPDLGLSQGVVARVSPPDWRSVEHARQGSPLPRCGNVARDCVEDVRVGLLLPCGQVLPVGDVAGLGVGEVLVDLRDPT